MNLMKRMKALVAAVGATTAITAASATWSIVIIDTRTGEVALASATCLTGFDLQANTPVMLVGRGGATAQSFVDSNGWNRTYIRDRFLDGWSPDQILDGLAVFDSGHQTRQYGFADVLGRTATFSGTGAGAWAGGQTGQIGDLVFAVQGNVLTGEPVVSLAVDAILNTPGDIAEKLMAGMEAARLMGGDGRCSCLPNDADACGSPPPSFEKSAHIAYMLIARRGDVDGSNANYRTGASPQAVASADFDADGLNDVVIVGAGGGTLSFFHNMTPPAGVPRLAPPAQTPFGGTLRDVVVLDFNSDGKPDLLTVDSDGSRFVPLRGVGDGSFQSEPTIPLLNSPRSITLLDLDGDADQDAAVASQTGGAVTILRNDAGVFSVLKSTIIGGGPNLITSGDLDADGRPDLVVGDTTGRLLALLRNAADDGTLESLATLPLPAAALALAARDLNHDGAAEVFATVNSTDQFVRVYTKSGPVWNLSTLPINGTAGGLRVDDLDADGIADLVVSTRSGPQRVNVLTGNADGTFDAARAFPGGWATPKFVFTDLNSDGALDLASVGAGGTILLPAREPGVFNPQSGQGGGDYYMTFNVPNAAASDPDPIYTLRDMFNAWRSGLVGIADAVKSQAAPDQTIIRADLRGSAKVTITLRDFTGAPVSVDPTNVRIEHAPGSAGVTIPGPVESGDNGALVATVVAGTRCGVDKLEIVVEHEPRDIVLMPAITLTVTSPADMNLDGVLSDADHQAFLAAFEAGSLDADLNADDFVNGDDFDSFAERFEAGC
ncbi:MAG: VCBS repeat-containing protein [Phycisphaerae bacterium]|nr:VCBS repeat-containing protein [Phycisphaerae bacterium]